MNEKLNKKDKRDLLLKTLASVREKLDKVELGNSTLEDDVKKEYRRRIFNKNDNNPDYGAELDRDIVTSTCDITGLNAFLDEMGSCWLDFFGSDSFSDSKKKQQVFFATLCKDETASDNRKAHVEWYRNQINEEVPIDVFIQLFFVPDARTKLKKVQDKGFYIDYGNATGNPDYNKDIKESNCTIQDLLKVLVNILEEEKDNYLFKLDYSKLCNQNDSKGRFIKGVCDLNKSLHEEAKHVYFLPIPCPDGSNGLVCFGTRNSLDLEDRRLLNALSFDILYPFVSSYKTAWQHNKIRKESIKSAIAAIMSRNMSHNLGSHFISNTKNYFNALIERDPNNVKNYRGIKHALQYIQERMDFIATITSSETYPYGAVNAKAQIFDELTPDDFGKRHGQYSYNFLMDYLVLSEKISKQSWGADGAVLSAGEHKMLFQIGYCDGKSVPVYWDPTKQEDTKLEIEENKRRDEILKINLAIPGGILGRHALFSIIENIIRNAAKHGQEKISGDFTIKMLYRTDTKRLVIFDNKEDKFVKKTVNSLKEKLECLHFLNEDMTLAQDNKGLKEMMACAIWLQNENVAQVMAENDTKSEKDRLRCFEKYLEVVAVDGTGIELKESQRTGYLGYSINLDQYKKIHYIDEQPCYEDLKDIKADIVCAKKDYTVERKSLSEIFPRFYNISKNRIISKKLRGLSSFCEIVSALEQESENILKTIVRRNCGNPDKLNMVVSYNLKYKDDTKVHLLDKWNKKGNAFLFKNHADKSQWEMFASLFLIEGFEDKYVDTVSGGNFTHTLIQPSFVEDGYNLLKIKESVATRFVIIDERIFEHYKSDMSAEDRKDLINGVKNMQKKGEKISDIMSYAFLDYASLGESFDEQKLQDKSFVKFCEDEKKLSSFLNKDVKQHYLERLGIYVFDLGEIKDDRFELKDLSLNTIEDFLLDGKKEDVKYNYIDNSNKTTFLSIHLGIIDKIGEHLKVKNKEEEIVEALKHYFNAQFVSIHSGRGGFDVRKTLKKYTFQSFSAIENPLYNSKYLLSQQFYNINYYGSK